MSLADRMQDSPRGRKKKWTMTGTKAQRKKLLKEKNKEAFTVAKEDLAKYLERSRFDPSSLKAVLEDQCRIPSLDRKTKQNQKLFMELLIKRGMHRKLSRATKPVDVIFGDIEIRSYADGNEYEVPLGFTLLKNLYD